MHQICHQFGRECGLKCGTKIATSVAQSQDEKYGSKSTTTVWHKARDSVAAVAADVAGRVASGATMVTSML